MKKHIWILCLLVLVFSLFVEEKTHGETERVAILYTSPERSKGIEVLPPNAIPNYFAMYKVGKKYFKVLYTESPIVIPRYWKKKYCSGFLLFVASGSEAYKRDFYSLFYREREGGYSLFFIFDSKVFNVTSGSGNKLICEIVVRFIKEFKFFMQFRRYKTDIPFPAVIELGS